MNNKLAYIIFILIFFSCKNEKSKIEQSEKETLIDTIAKPIQTNYLQNSELSSFLKLTDTFQNNNNFKAPFNDIQFNKVIAYDFEGQGDSRPTVYWLNQKRFSREIITQKELNAEQVNNLIGFLTKNETYGGSTAACFDPKLGIIFYQNNEVKFVIDICLDCNFLRSTKEIPATSFKQMHFESGGSYDLNGFSKFGIENIVSLSKALDFRYGSFESQRFIED